MQNKITHGLTTMAAVLPGAAVWWMDGVIASWQPGDSDSQAPSV